MNKKFLNKYTILLSFCNRFDLSCDHNKDTSTIKTPIDDQDKDISKIGEDEIKKQKLSSKDVEAYEFEEIKNINNRINETYNPYNKYIPYVLIANTLMVFIIFVKIVFFGGHTQGYYPYQQPIQQTPQVVYSNPPQQFVTAY